MTYEWREHTSELALHVSAASLEEVFGEALAAFGRLVERGAGGERAERDVAVAAPDRGALLVAWLDELVYLADAHSFVPDRVRSLELAGHSLRARLEGRIAEHAPLVKAATYHDLELVHERGLWRARVVVDV